MEWTDVVHTASSFRIHTHSVTHTHSHTIWGLQTDGAKSGQCPRRKFHQDYSQQTCAARLQVPMNAAFLQASQHSVWAGGQLWLGLCHTQSVGWPQKMEFLGCQHPACQPFSPASEDQIKSENNSYNNNNEYSECLTHTGPKRLHVLYKYILSTFNACNMNAHTHRLTHARTSTCMHACTHTHTEFLRKHTKTLHSGVLILSIVSPADQWSQVPKGLLNICHDHKDIASMI